MESGGRNSKKKTAAIPYLYRMVAVAWQKQPVSALKCRNIKYGPFFFRSLRLLLALGRLSICKPCAAVNSVPCSLAAKPSLFLLKKEAAT